MNSFCRRFVTAHYEMVPYLLTTGAEAFDKRRSSITPLAKHNNFIEKVSGLVVVHGSNTTHHACCINTRR